ncbi:MAG TPA: hypothetical protein VHC43_15290 [Mycobacteriales bacterium]|nr:hypothetical protein [Mycobacteriales bacterium]
MPTRRLTQALVAGGIAALGVGGFAPTIASAASNNDAITVAGGSSYTYTFNQSPSIQATAQPNCAVFSNPAPVTLTISGPGVVSSTLVSHKADCNNALTLSPSASSVNTRHPAWAGGPMASNGVFTVTLNNEGRTKSATFVLLIPPAKPSGLTVTPNSASTATFNWPANPEPDITGYEITSSTGSVIADPTSADCSGGACSVGPVDLGSSVAGTSEHYSITAIRSCGNATCSAGHIASTSSASGSADFPAAPTPTPTPTPSKSSGGSGNTGGAGNTGGGSGGNGSGGGSTSLGTVTTGSGGGRGGGHSGSVNLGNADSAGQVSHNLPPASVGSIPSFGDPVLPPAQTSLGAQDNTPPGKIHYPKPLIAHKSASAPQTIEKALKNGLSLPPLWRGIAAAAVLILIAVHLRAWVARTEAF